MADARGPFDGYVAFDGMSWPLATGVAQSETRYALIHGTPTRKQLLLAASVMAAYQQMVYDPGWQRAKVVRVLREMGLRQTDPAPTPRRRKRTP